MRNPTTFLWLLKTSFYIFLFLCFFMFRISHSLYLSICISMYKTSCVGFLYFLPIPWNNSCLFNSNFWQFLPKTVVKKPEEVCTPPAPARTRSDVLQGFLLSYRRLLLKKEETIRKYLSFFSSVFCRTTGKKRLRYKRALTLMNFKEKTETYLPCIWKTRS